MATDPMPDLPESARSETRAGLLAGSAGYQYFLQQLATYISPEESHHAHARFRAAARAFWITLIAFLLAYIGINQLLGPHGPRPSAWGNDALRGVLFLIIVFLTRRLRISVAGQILLPFASLCFLPFPVAPEANWWQSTLTYLAVVVALFCIGWCLDAGSEQNGQSKSRLPLLANRLLPRLALLLFALLNLVAWKWIVDEATPPIFSIAATLLALLFIESDRRKNIVTNDIDFLASAAWKRWRFLFTGRALAVILGIVPFLLFSNLLDYQEELERAAHRAEAPDILRMDYKIEKWVAFYWRQEGRFLAEADLKPTEPEKPPEPGEPPEPVKPQVVHAFYLLFPTYLTRPDSEELPKEFRGPDHAIAPVENLNISDLKEEMLALNRLPMSRDAFDEHLKKFAPLRLISRERLLRRTTEPIDLISRSNMFVISYYPTGATIDSPDEGMVFVETPDLNMRGADELARLIDRYDHPKWIFFAFGVLGFVFLWRRGGDSSLARWIGVWLVGTTLIPSLTASDDTLPHLTHWLWQQSILHHWNTLASIAQPLFSLFYLAATSTAILWMCQIPQALCWVYLCWPTKILPQHPPIVRSLIILGKLTAALCANFLIFGITVFPILFLRPRDSFLQFSVFLAFTTIAFLISGAVARKFTAPNAEVPRLGFWPVLAIITLNLTILLYGPSLMFSNDDTPITSAYIISTTLASYCGCLFIAILGFMILKRDFLRVRAIPGLIMLLLLIFIPWFFHTVEEIIPHYLTSTPFFHERGAEMVCLMLLVFVFPRLHELLHEFLLAVSTPKLRYIEHRVEHALEEIVDAEDDHARAHMVSELFDKLHVPSYLFLSRRAKGLFITDINKLGKSVPPTLEFSHELREFLGRHHHFIDLQSMAYEWPFFFHQFELYRLTQTTDCRFLLPISVGESLRGILLLPETPGSTVVSNPAVSPNINNLGIAATLFRPKQ